MRSVAVIRELTSRLDGQAVAFDEQAKRNNRNECGPVSPHLLRPSHLRAVRTRLSRMQAYSAYSAGIASKI
jgi:hypothetical protein